MRSLRGYTLVELLIVIGILAILAALSLSAFTTLKSHSTLDSDAAQLLSELEQARSLALNGKDASAWGVHLASSSVTLFEGSTYSAGAAGNTVTTLDPSLSLSSVSLAGGGSDVVFSRLSGETSDTGTVTLSLIASSSVSKTITVYGTGVSQLQ